MMKDKRVLGKGLAALISENVLVNTDGDDNSAKHYGELDISKVKTNPFQPRREFNEADISELGASIKQHGVLQPIIVRKVGDYYEIVAGERRYRAAKLLEYKSIPAIVKDLSDKEAFEIALIENIQRENLTAIEEAQGYEKLIKEFGHTHESLSKILGKSRSHISNTMRLLTLPEEVKKLVRERKITAGHAKSLVNLPDASDLAQKIVNDNWSVRRTEDEIRKRNNPRESKHRHTNLISEGAYKHFEKDTDLLEVEKLLSEELNTRVQINDYPGNGQIIIDFNTLEELDLLLARLGGNHLKF
jgi:ParB family chromosome partitioning protein